MILRADDFEAAARGGSQVACLPQIDENWCLAVKTRSATGYLGDEHGKEMLFATLDEAIGRAKKLGVGQVLVITGTKEWRL